MHPGTRALNVRTKLLLDQALHYRHAPGSILPSGVRWDQRALSANAGDQRRRACSILHYRPVKLFWDSISDG